MLQDTPALGVDCCAAALASIGLAEESAIALTLKRAGGANDVVPRKRIETIASTGVSLMPEGLEAGLQVLARVHETEYDVTHHGDSFFIRTNDGAKTFRVIQAPVTDPSKPNWKEFLPARAGVTVESVTAFRNHLVVEERDRGLTRIRIQSLKNHLNRDQPHYIEFPEPVYAAGVGANAEFDPVGVGRGTATGGATAT